MRQLLFVGAASVLASAGCNLPNVRDMPEDWYGLYAPECEDDEARSVVVDRDGLTFYESQLEVHSQQWDDAAQEWALEGSLNEHGSRTPAGFWIERGPDGRSISLSSREPRGGRSAPELLKFCSGTAPWR